MEMGLESSALRLKNIEEAIHCAQRSVLFPLAPLYDLTQKTITP